MFCHNICNRSVKIRKIFYLYCKTAIKQNIILMYKISVSADEALVKGEG